MWGRDGDFLSLELRTCHPPSLPDDGPCLLKRKSAFFLPPSLFLSLSLSVSPSGRWDRRPRRSERFGPFGGRAAARSEDRRRAA